MANITIGTIVMIDEKIEGEYRKKLPGEYQPDYSKQYRVTDTDGDRAIVLPVDGIGKGWVVSYEALTPCIKS